MTEREIFEALLDLPNAAARTAFLDRACADDAALRAAVERLVAAHHAAGDFLAAPAADPETTLDSGDAPPDDLAFLAPARRAGSLGRVGHYEVFEVLGRGGFGVVLRAFDDVLQRVVAIKVLAPSMAATSPARKRFLREARASARVRHDNLVQVYEIGEEPLPYIVMEFVPGETLQQRVDRTGPLDPGEAVLIARQLAEGLAAAHGAGLIHRDIKPANILVETGPQPHVKITDFGLARTVDDASQSQSGVAGTPKYMSPEQARGEALDHRTDLFSLGSVMYKMVTGRSPFRASGALSVMRRVVEARPRPIPEIVPEVPAWLCDLIGKLHAKDPADRIPTARAVADLLAQPVMPTKPVQPRRRWAVAAAVVLAVVGLGAEATGVTRVGRTLIRLLSPHGTLVLEVDDLNVSVSVLGEDVIITGAGVKEIRLRPGRYKVHASKDGRTVREELVTVERDGRQVVRVSREATLEPPSIAGLTPDQQTEAVRARLKELNPGFDGTMQVHAEDGHVVHIHIGGTGVRDLSPLRALPRLRIVEVEKCPGLTDLSPLRGLPLRRLQVHYSGVTDLSPLRGMDLPDLDLSGAAGLRDLSPLAGMPLVSLGLPATAVSDLSPLRGMKLEYLGLAEAPVRDLSPLAGMTLKRLYVEKTQVGDLTPVKLLRELNELSFQHSQVTDLAPLKGLPLAILNCSHTSVTDLTPLVGMKLKVFYCDNTRAADLSVLKGMPLRELNCRGYDLSREANKAAVKSLADVEVINSEMAAGVLKGLE